MSCGGLYCTPLQILVPLLTQAALFAAIGACLGGLMFGPAHLFDFALGADPVFSRRSLRRFAKSTAVVDFVVFMLVKTTMIFMHERVHVPRWFSWLDSALSYGAILISAYLVAVGFELHGRRKPRT